MIAMTMYPTRRPEPTAAAAGVQEVARGIQHHIKLGLAMDGPHDALRRLAATFITAGWHAFHSELGEDANSEMRFGNQREEERVSSSQVMVGGEASPATTLEFGLPRSSRSVHIHQPHTAIGSLQVHSPMEALLLMKLNKCPRNFLLMQQTIERQTRMGDS